MDPLFTPEGLATPQYRVNVGVHVHIHVRYDCMYNEGTKVHNPRQ